MKEKHVKHQTKLLSADDISIFCAQIALILKSAIPLQDGLVAIYENISDKAGKEILKSIADEVANNGKLYHALERAGVFPTYMVNMVRIGEKSGKLESVMNSLSLYYEREEALRKRIKSAILYPTILVLMMCVVLTVLIVTVLPVFRDVFESMGSDMSSTATVFMNIGLSIGKYAYIILLILVLFISFLFFFSQTKKGAKRVSSIIENFFLTKRLSQRIASARFSSVMSMMFSSGYHTDEALELVAMVVNNHSMESKVTVTRELIRKGYTFAQAVNEAKIFSGIYSRMILIGEKTGSLDSVMDRLAVIYNERAEDSIDKTVALIEPTLVGMLCFVIGIILMTVMLPLMGIMSSIG